MLGRDRRIYRELNKDAVLVDDYDHTPRQKPDTIKEASSDRFHDNRGILDEQADPEGGLRAASAAG